jgi:hypothetical protein
MDRSKPIAYRDQILVTYLMAPFKSATYGRPSWSVTRFPSFNLKESPEIGAQFRENVFKKITHGDQLCHVKGAAGSRTRSAARRASTERVKAASEAPPLLPLTEN